MQHHSFYLDNGSGREVIKDHLSPVTVNIYRLANESFAENPEMMTCYGSDLGSFLAFESAYIVENLPTITEALKWYCKAINYPDMQFHVDDPRGATPASMRLIR